MKSLLYKLFALIFNISRVMPLKRGRIALLAPHPREKYDSLSAIKEFLLLNDKYELIEINVPHNKEKSQISDYLKFFLSDSAKLARSEYIFLNDNFMPLADLNISDKTVITQLWHGEGAFKKFGLLMEQEEEIKSRLIKCTEKTDYIICTSDKLRKVYADAFGADIEKVIALGSPRTDYLLTLDINEIRESFEAKHPETKGKKIILYAPTFRDEAVKDSSLLENNDFNYLNNELGNDYTILIKLHPGIHSSKVPEGVIDVTRENITELTVLSDILITDYSSVCMNFAYLNKPVIFYAFDLDDYNETRSFCFGYENYVPGPIIKDYKEIPEKIKNPPDSEKIREFGEFNFKYIDNDNTERIIKKVIGNL